MKDVNNRNYLPECMTLTSKSLNTKEMRNRNKTPNSPKAVIGINKIDGSIIVFNAVTDAKFKGFKPGAISNCCQGKKYHKSHDGYTWHYLYLEKL